jgi:hypothetical protein
MTHQTSARKQHLNIQNTSIIIDPTISSSTNANKINRYLVDWQMDRLAISRCNECSEEEAHIFEKG